VIHPGSRRVLRTVAKVVGFVVLLWCLAGAGLYVAMLQPPETFGAVMSRLPSASMIVLPFKPLWMFARAGALRVGDQAPDFTLPILHGDRSVSLSREYREKPVVLIFGSYT
jgi:hypothetical protein